MGNKLHYVYKTVLWWFSAYLCTKSKHGLSRRNGFGTEDWECLICTAAVTKLDQIRYDDIERNLKLRRDIIDEVGIRRLINTLGTSQGWNRIVFHTLLRMTELMESRGRGRPRQDGIDTINKDCETRGMKFFKAQRATQERTNWRTNWRTILTTL